MEVGDALVQDDNRRNSTNTHSSTMEPAILHSLSAGEPATNAQIRLYWAF